MPDHKPLTEIQLTRVRFHGQMVGDFDEPGGKSITMATDEDIRAAGAEIRKLQSRPLEALAAALQADNARLNGELELEQKGRRALEDHLENWEAENVKLCRWKVKYGQRITRLEADNAKLRAALEWLRDNADEQRGDAAFSGDYQSADDWQICAKRASEALATKEPDHE